MRLDFNIVFVDDEYSPDNCHHLNELIDTINTHLSNKGFKFISHCFSSIQECQNAGLDNRRIDLYISDYNLLQKETGIDLYLKLKDKFICNFILYSKSNNEDILKQLIDELNKELTKEQDNEISNPNLFSRFSFVSRNSGTEWHEGITDILDHLITTREEMNTLRGLFAHITAKMHQKLKDIPAVNRELNKLSTLERENFSKAIQIAFKKNIITKDIKKDIETQRDRRNEIIHNDEQFDSKNNEFFIPFDITIESKFNGKIYLKHFPELRLYLRETYNTLESHIEKK